MKKLMTLLFAVIMITMTASAQDTLKSKNGHTILPQAGDCSIGFDAVPVLNYFGNLFNSSKDNTIKMSWQVDNTIVGSHMATNDKAYRVAVRLAYASNKDTAGVTTTSNAVNLGAGVIHYKGGGRLQGFYGYEGMLSFGSNAEKTNSFGIGVKGVLGVQYFFAPKMCLGAEYGWGPSYTKVGDASSVSIDTDNGNGGIFLSFYF